MIYTTAQRNSRLDYRTVTFLRMIFIILDDDNEIKRERIIVATPTTRHELL